MKKSCLPLAVMFLAWNVTLYAQDAKLHLRDFTPRYTISEIKVGGACGLCTQRILHALKVPGVKSAFWDQADQQLTVQYEENKISLQNIHVLLAAAGHDTDTVKAANDVYAKLPSCCHYQRKPAGAQPAAAESCDGHTGRH